MKIKASDIKKLIRWRYSGIKNWEAPKWVVLSEVRTGTAFMSKWKTRGGPFGHGYIDMMVFNCWPSSGFLRIAFEIKTNRADFLEELKKPEKRWLAMMYSHQFYFVAPEGVIKYNELPPECGWMEVKQVLGRQKDGELKLRTVCRAPIREASPMSQSLIMSVIRRAYKEGIETGRLFEREKSREKHMTTEEFRNYYNRVRKEEAGIEAFLRETRKGKDKR